MHKLLPPHSLQSANYFLCKHFGCFRTLILRESAIGAEGTGEEGTGAEFNFIVSVLNSVKFNFYLPSFFL
jgi:hypothetical protein